MSSSLKKTSAEDWAAKQADAIVNAFLADNEPEDLLRLERAIADALRAAYKSGEATQRKKPGS